MPSPFGLSFPAIKGIQAGREYYASMCPLRLLPRIFTFNEAELQPELRAQRQLNRGRLPELSRYITQNVESYVFSAITASIDGDVEFIPMQGADPDNRIGSLRVAMDARFIINDGQHRRGAIELALQERPELADETIAVVFFVDQGLKRCQQMFADLNRYAIRPSRSIGVLYDHRDDRADLVRLVVQRLPLLRDVVELEKTTLSPRSRRLFTLSALYTASGALLSGLPYETPEERADVALKYWTAVTQQFTDWQRVKDGNLSAGEVRQDFIHSHGVVLHALGRVGNALLMNDSKNWQEPLGKLSTIDWHRSNHKLWEGRAMIGGRISKNQQHVALTTNAIKKALGVDLLPEEQIIENKFSEDKINAAAG